MPNPRAAGGSQRGRSLRLWSLFFSGICPLLLCPDCPVSVKMQEDGLLMAAEFTSLRPASSVTFIPTSDPQERQRDWSSFGQVLSLLLSIIPGLIGGGEESRNTNRSWGSILRVWNVIYRERRFGCWGQTTSDVSITCMFVLSCSENLKHHLCACCHKLVDVKCIYWLIN